MPDPAPRLPARPSLEQLRKQAKMLLRLHRDGDAAARARFAAILPRFATDDPTPHAVLADAQFVLAREYGFQNWSALARHVGALRPADQVVSNSPPIRPIELASSRSVQLPTGGVAPGDAVWEVFLAARAGDLHAVEKLVARYPGIERVEYNYTPPIHFAVREGHVELVRFLVGHGADLAYTTYPFGDSLVTMADDREHHEVGRLLRSVLARRFALAEGTNAILAAARDGDLARVQAEIARNPRLARASTDTGETALHLAVERGALDVVTALLDAGADADAIRGDGYKPVHCAYMRTWRAGVTRDQARVLADTLLARGARYTIFVAALAGDLRFVRDALQRDSSFANFEDTCHHRPISAAARRGDLEMVRLLLEHGADPNLPEEGAPRGHALWDAVYHRQHEMARLLVAHGADPNAMVESSGTPMGHARKDPELFELLAAHGGHLESTDEERLERLIGEGNLAEVERVLQRRPDLVHNECAFWSEGLLAGPASAPNRDMVALLLRHGARVPTVTKWGRYYYFKHTEMVAFLLDHGMSPHHMNWHRTTILHHVAADGDLAQARLLLDHGADIDAIDEEYRSTPLGMAARWGRLEMVTFLLDRGANADAAATPWATPQAWARRKGHGTIERLLRDEPSRGVDS